MATPPRNKRPLGEKPSIFNLDSSPLPQKRKKPFSLQSDTHQMVLDAGQKQLGAQYCSECGMVYSVDCQKDMKEHDKHHNKFDELFKVTRNQLETFEKANPGSIRHLDYNSSAKRKCAVLTASCKPTSFFNRVLRIITEIINDELGFPSDISVWGKDNRCSVLAMLDKKDHHFIIVCILVRENIRRAHWCDTEEIFENQLILGINRIWTNPVWRKKGLAKLLINFDFKRSPYCKNIAFTDLTEAGRKLAEKISGSHRYLLYSISK